MKKTAFLLFALLLWLKAPAQEHIKIAALDSILRTKLPDTTRAIKLSLLCYYLSDINPDTARIYGLKGLALARKTGNETSIADCESNLGWLEFRQGNYAEAKRLIKSATERFRSQGLNSGLISTLHNLGNIYMNESDYPQAFKCFEEYLSLAENSGNTIKTGYAHNNFGRFYRAQGNFEESEKHYLQALKIFEENEQADLVSDALCNLGNIRFLKGAYESSIGFYKKALETEAKTNRQHQIALVCENMAQSFSKLHRFPEAFQSFEKSKRIYEKLNARNDLTTLAQAIGEAYMEMGDLPRAKLEFEHGLKMATENHFTDLELRFCDNLTEMAVKSGDYCTAYTFSQRAESLRDSLYKSDSDRELLQLQTKFEIAQKEKELQTKTREAERLQVFVAFGALALLLVTLLAAGFWWRSWHRRRTNEQLVAKNLEIEAARDRAERSEAVKKQFLANMSHEIRTPLNALVGISNLLAKQPVADEKTAHYHQILQKSSENLLVIVNDILDYSKLEAGKLRLDPAPFCLPDLLKLTADMFQEKAAEKGIALETDFDIGLPQWIFGDMHYLTQVLNNLLSNAIKFTEKGSVQLRVHPAVHETDQPSIHFSVSDTGLGIPSENLTRIFESFEQVNAGSAKQFGGAGLGLAISKEIVALMGGHLQVKSNPGTGSEFWFEIALPEVAPPESQSLAGNNGQTPGLQLSKSIRVLLAEDNAYNQVVATESLAALSPDFQVSIAANGYEALALLEKNTFDLLLLDVQMPGMDGYELAHLLREHPNAHLRSLPVIALTASVVATDIERCMSSGMNGYVPKPFQISQLASEILRVLPEKTALSLSEKDPSEQTVPPVTSLAAFEKLTADLPGQRHRMLHLLIDGFAEKAAPFEAAIHLGDRAAFAKIVHALRPLTISAGMTGIQNNMTEIETNWAAMTENDWQSQARFFNITIGQALKELRNNL